MEAPSTVTEILAALGLKLHTMIAGAVGSFVSLRFFEGLSSWQRWTTFCGGWALAAYLAEPVTALLELPPKIELGASLVIGLFGMSVAAQVMHIPWDEVFWGVLAKFGVKREGGGK